MVEGESGNVHCSYNKIQHELYRIPLVIAVTMQLIFGVLASVATNFWLFVLCRFLTAVATGGTMVTSFVLVMELIGTSWRELVSVVYQIPFNLGHLLLPLFGYFIRDWQKFQFAISIPSIILLSYYWLIPESPSKYFMRLSNKLILIFEFLKDGCTQLDESMKPQKL